MKRNWSQLTIMLSGSFLIVFGVVLIIAQAMEGAADQLQGVPGASKPLQLNEFQQQMTASKDGFTAVTHYVGVELVIVGAVLQMVGFVGGSFSKVRQQENNNEKVDS